MERIFKGSYTLSKEMMQEAYGEYLKKSMRFKNIMTVVYIILGLYFLFLGIFNGEGTTSFVLAFVCLAIGVVTWYNPRRMKRSVIEIFDEISGDRYECTISEQSVEIETAELAEHTEDASDEEIEKAAEEGREGIEKTVFNYTKETIVIEKDEYYIIGNKTVFFVFPKESFGNDCDEITEIFMQKCGKNYSRR